MFSLPVSVDANTPEHSERTKSASSASFWRMFGCLFQRPGRAPILDESSFRAGLRREQRRQERSSRAFIVVKMTAPELFGPAGNNRLRKRALRVLSATARQTDTVGWIESGRVLGLICTELGATSEIAAREAILARLEETANLHMPTAHLALKVESYGPRNGPANFAIRRAQVSR